MSVYYTIYLSKNDEIVASGSSRECMQQLNIKSVNAFHSLVSKSIKGKRKKYTVLKEHKFRNGDDE